MILQVFRVAQEVLQNLPQDCLMLLTAIHVSDEQPRGRGGSGQPEKCLAVNEGLKSILVGRTAKSVVEDGPSSHAYTFDHVVRNCPPQIYDDVVRQMILQMVPSDAANVSSLVQSARSGVAFLYGSSLGEKKTIFDAVGEWSLKDLATLVQLTNERFVAEELSSADGQQRSGRGGPHYEDPHAGLGTSGSGAGLSTHQPKWRAELECSLLDFYHAWTVLDLFDDEATDKSVAALQQIRTTVGSHPIASLQPKRVLVSTPEHVDQVILPLIREKRNVPALYTAKAKEDHDHTNHLVLTVRVILRDTNLPQYVADRARQAGSGYWSASPSSVALANIHSSGFGPAGSIPVQVLSTLHVIRLADTDFADPKNKLSVEFGAIAATLHALTGQGSSGSLPHLQERSGGRSSSVTRGSKRGSGNSGFVDGETHLPLRESKVLMYVQKELLGGAAGVEPETSTNSLKGKAPPAAHQESTHHPSSGSQIAFVIAVPSAIDHYRQVSAACHFVSRFADLSGKSAAVNRKLLQQQIQYHQYQQQQQQLMNFQRSQTATAGAAGRWPAADGRSPSQHNRSGSLRALSAGMDVSDLSPQTVEDVSPRDATKGYHHPSRGPVASGRQPHSGGIGNQSRSSLNSSGSHIRREMDGAEQSDTSLMEDRRRPAPPSTVYQSGHSQPQHGYQPHFDDHQSISELSVIPSAGGVGAEPIITAGAVPVPARTEAARPLATGLRASELSFGSSDSSFQAISLQQALAAQSRNSSLSGQSTTSRPGAGSRPGTSGSPLSTGVSPSPSVDNRHVPDRWYIPNSRLRRPGPGVPAVPAPHLHTETPGAPAPRPDEPGRQTSPPAGRSSSTEKYPQQQTTQPAAPAPSGNKKIHSPMRSENRYERQHTDRETTALAEELPVAERRVQAAAAEEADREDRYWSPPPSQVTHHRQDEAKVANHQSSNGISTTFFGSAESKRPGTGFGESSGNRFGDARTMPRPTAGTHHSLDSDGLVASRLSSDPPLHGTALTGAGAGGPREEAADPTSLEEADNMRLAAIIEELRDDLRRVTAERDILLENRHMQIQRLRIADSASPDPGRSNAIETGTVVTGDRLSTSPIMSPPQKGEPRTGMELVPGSSENTGTDARTATHGTLIPRVELEEAEDRYNRLVQENLDLRRDVPVILSDLRHALVDRDEHLARCTVLEGSLNLVQTKFAEVSAELDHLRATLQQQQQDAERDRNALKESLEAEYRERLISFKIKADRAAEKERQDAKRQIDELTAKLQSFLVSAQQEGTAIEDAVTLRESLKREYEEKLKKQRLESRAELMAERRKRTDLELKLMQTSLDLEERNTKLLQATPLLDEALQALENAKNSKGESEADDDVVGALAPVESNKRRGTK
jgi:hypothetical protein